MKTIVSSKECLVGIYINMHKQDLVNLESLKTVLINRSIKHPR